jgi:uncharacterized protein (TIGR02246 family)
MRSIVLGILALTVGAVTISSAQTRSADKTEHVRATVQAFLDAFNDHNFANVAGITTDDWVHINPFGGRTSGRGEVLKEIREVHSTFLKGVSMKIDEISVKFATPDVALVTVVNQITPYTTPDGVNHSNERQIKTFIVLKRNNKWLIMHDQNTIIATR